MLRFVNGFTLYHRHLVATINECHTIVGSGLANITLTLLSDTKEVEHLLLLNGDRERNLGYVVADAIMAQIQR